MDQLKIFINVFYSSLKTFPIHYEMALYNIRTFKTFNQMAALLKPQLSFLQIPV